MKKSKILTFIFLGLSFITLIIAITLSININLTKVKTITEIDKDVSYTQITTNISELYDKTKKGCVGIVAKNSKYQAVGSGVIYKVKDDNYYVITNAHVVNGFDKIYIFLEDAYENAEILGTDMTNDVAVLKFTLSPKNSNLKEDIYIHNFLEYEKKYSVNVGENIIAIGCPISISNYNTLSKGIITQVTDKNICTDATVNQGNSGGGMFNMEGKLIGIIYSKDAYLSDGTTVEGRSFAIPFDIFKNSVLNIEKNNGDVVRPTLNISVVAVNSILEPESTYLKFIPEDNLDTHFIVNNIQANSPCVDKLELYDTILKVNGKDYISSNDLANTLHLMTKDDVITLTVYRFKTQETLDFTISFK